MIAYEGLGCEEKIVEMAAQYHAPVRIVVPTRKDAGRIRKLMMSVTGAPMYIVGEMVVAYYDNDNVVDRIALARPAAVFVLGWDIIGDAMRSESAWDYIVPIVEAVASRGKSHGCAEVVRG